MRNLLILIVTLAALAHAAIPVEPTDTLSPSFRTLAAQLAE